MRSVHRRPGTRCHALVKPAVHGSISMALALRRLKDLNLITDAGYQGMNMQFSAKGWRTSEPEPLRPEKPRRFESLVYRALAEDLISLPRAAELLQLTVAELDPNLNACR